MLVSRTIMEANDEESSVDAAGPARAYFGQDSKGAAWLIAPLIVLAITALIYGSIYFREESLATGIGANLECLGERAFANSARSHKDRPDLLLSPVRTCPYNRAFFDDR